MNAARPLVFLIAFAGFHGFLKLTFAYGGIVYSTPDSMYAQNFDSLASSIGGGWTNDSTPLPGWSSFSGTNGTTAIANYQAGNGSGSGTATWSFGATGDINRALGSINGSTTAPRNIAVAFVNSAGATLDSFTVNYDGEQWRKAVSSQSQSLVFSYGFGTTFTSVSSWTNVSALDFVSPIANGSPATALDGNAAANRQANINASITGINWQSSDTLWLRWTDPPKAFINSAHGLAIDNFSFSASRITAVPEPSSCLLLGTAGIAFLFHRQRRSLILIVRS